jgi:predicted dehydrogenase
VNDFVRFVVAGLGWWGRSWTDILMAHPGVQLVATVDPSAAAREWSREKLGVRHFEGLDEVFGEMEADAVLVVTPPKLHFPVLMRVIELGRHALVEKPLVASSGEVAGVLTALKNSSSKVMVGQGYRFTDSTAVVRQALQGGSIGELHAVRVLFRQYVPDILAPGHPLYQLNHSILLDMANHHFDLIRFLTGRDFSKVAAFEYETPDNLLRYPSSAFCLLTLDNGVRVTWDGDWCRSGFRTSWEGDWELIGSQGRMFWRGERDLQHRNRYVPSVTIERPNGEVERIAFEESIVDRRGPVLNHFVESVLKGGQPEPSVWDNARVLRAVFGCIESLSKGGEIDLGD